MTNLKTVLSVFAVILVMIGTGALFLFQEQNSNQQSLDADEFLRIHIRANSNSDKDQTVKYKVKDEVVKALTPILSEANSKQKALTLVKNNTSLIETVANRVLLEEGFNYKSHAELKKEHFPTRTYDGLTLQSDIYDALILNLGLGGGDNWWCVAYPPLCFVGAESDGSNQIVYRSKLMEIIKKFFN